MDGATPSADLVQRLRAGEADAATELFARYAQRLSRLAEQHLSRGLSARLDGEDVVQSVFRTFFQRCARGEFRIDSAAQTWRLLVKITILKARAKGRQHTAEKRDIEAEAGPEWLAVALSREPGPDEAAVLVDEISALLRGLPPQHAHILDLRLQGHDVPTIARALTLSRQTIYRALNLLQARLGNERLFDPPS